MMYEGVEVDFNKLRLADGSEGWRDGLREACRELLERVREHPEEEPAITGDILKHLEETGLRVPFDVARLMEQALAAHQPKDAWTGLLEQVTDPDTGGAVTEAAVAWANLPEFDVSDAELDWRETISFVWGQVLRAEAGGLLPRGVSPARAFGGMLAKVQREYAALRHSQTPPLPKSVYDYLLGRIREDEDTLHLDKTLQALLREPDISEVVQGLKDGSPLFEMLLNDGTDNWRALFWALWTQWKREYPQPEASAGREGLAAYWHTFAQSLRMHSDRKEVVWPQALLRVIDTCRVKGLSVTDADMIFDQMAHNRPLPDPNGPVRLSWRDKLRVAKHRIEDASFAHQHKVYVEALLSEMDALGPLSGEESDDPELTAFIAGLTAAESLEQVERLVALALEPETGHEGVRPPNVTMTPALALEEKEALHLVWSRLPEMLTRKAWVPGMELPVLKRQLELFMGKWKDARVVLWDVNIWKAAAEGDLSAFEGDVLREEDVPKGAEYWSFSRDVVPDEAFLESMKLDVPCYLAGVLVTPTYWQNTGASVVSLCYVFQPRMMDPEDRLDAVIPRLRFIAAHQVGEPLHPSIWQYVAAKRFMDLPFVTYRAGHKQLNWSTRKAFQKAGRPEPEIQVVILRKAVDPSHTEKGSHGFRDIQYSCKWLVHGHWRKAAEFYKDKRPRWISPYIKGNMDAPFKPPKEQVVVVKR